MRINPKHSWDPERIVALRKAIGVTQEAMARRIGVSMNTLARWEQGRSRCSQLAARRLAQMEAEAQGSSAGHE